MSIAYTREGTGRPLLLVHGIGMSGATWVEVSAALRDRFDVVSVDLPGFGSSDPLETAPTVPALARVCEALMRDELGFRDGWSVAGNSLGGGIAVHLALSGAVSAGVALSPIGFVGQGWERAWLHGTMSTFKPLAGVLRATVPPLPAPLRRAMAVPYAWHGDRIGRSRLRAAFADLRDGTGMHPTRRAAFRWAPAAGTVPPVPLTIAWGERDFILWAGPQSARARATLPGATHVGLPGVGHLPTWDAPEETARLIADAVGG